MLAYTETTLSEAAVQGGAACHYYCSAATATVRKSAMYIKDDIVTYVIIC
jgi:hypothetical protein